MRHGQDLAWETAAQDFRGDGGLRDIYVLDATLGDWQAAFDHVRTMYDPVRFTIDGEPAALPSTVTEIFPIWERASPALQFEVGESKSPVTSSRPTKSSSTCGRST